MSKKQLPDIRAVSQGRRIRLPHPTVSKRKISVTVLIVSILFIALGLFAFSRYRPKQQPIVNCQPYVDKIAAKVEQKSYTIVVDLADQYLKMNCSNDNKVALLDQKGIALFSQNKLDEAEKVFLQVEPLNGGKLDPASAQTLAAISYKKGNKEDAVKYYKALIQAVKVTPSNDDDGYIPQYKIIIKNLGGTT